MTDCAARSTPARASLTGSREREREHEHEAVTPGGLR